MANSNIFRDIVDTLTAINEMDRRTESLRALRAREAARLRRLRASERVVVEVEYRSAGVKLVNDLKAQTWDSSRDRILSEFLAHYDYNVEFSSESIADIVNTFDFDTSKRSAIRQLKRYCSDSWRLERVLARDTSMLKMHIRSACR